LEDGATFLAVYLLCFSDEEPGTQGPRRVSQREIRAVFDDAWTVEEIRAGTDVGRQVLEPTELLLRAGRLH
jgi:hypothetical protein